MMTGRYLLILLCATALVVGCTDDGSLIDGNRSDSDVQLVLLKPGDAIPGRYIVLLDEDIATAQVPDVASDMARKRTAEVGHIYRNGIRGFSAKMSASDAAALGKDSRVIAVEPDRVVALAPPPGKGKPDKGGGGNDDPAPTAQQTPWGIEAIGGASNGTGSNAVRIWILDTGIDLDHPDLNVHRGLSANFAKGKSADDGNGHGTHVAGTAAAIDNSFGVVGVAAGAEVVAVRVLGNNGSGSYSDVIAGLDYISTKGSSGEVVNMSLGGPRSTALDNAVIALVTKGMHVVVAAGNDARDASNDSPGHLGNDYSRIYTISAHDGSNCLASWSNHGADIDYAAPGVGILSTWKGGGLATIGGTSMAAPHVTGLIAIGSLNSNGSIGCGDSDGVAEPIAHR